MSCGDPTEKLYYTAKYKPICIIAQPPCKGIGKERIITLNDRTVTTSLTHRKIEC